MAVNIHFMYFGKHTLNFSNPGITKFQHMATFPANNMIVLLISVSPFVIILAFAKLLTLHQSTFNQKIQGIINRCSGNACSALLHSEEDIICIKMAVGGVDFPKHSKSLWCLPLVTFF